MLNANAEANNSTIHYTIKKGDIPDLIYSGDILAITKSPEVDIQKPTKNVSLKEIHAIVNDLNHSELNKYSPLNARYESGWIKMDNINFNLAAYDWSMSIVKRVLENHKVKIVDYTVENVQWEDPRATLHWGTVCIKVGKK